jgi:ABC-type transporter Mla subunit MlaD
VAVQISGRRKTSKETSDTPDRTFAEQRQQLDTTLAKQREQLDTTLVAQREQLDRTLAAQREQLNRTLEEQRTRTLNERFATAAGQLGGDKPPAVRLAGVYAMAVLADEWPENRQTCVDVLCGYLRMPYQPDPGQDAPRPAAARHHVGHGLDQIPQQPHAATITGPITAP